MHTHSPPEWLVSLIVGINDTIIGRKHASDQMWARLASNKNSILFPKRFPCRALQPQLPKLPWPCGRVDHHDSPHSDPCRCWTFCTNWSATTSRLETFCRCAPTPLQHAPLHRLYYAQQPQLLELRPLHYILDACNNALAANIISKQYPPPCSSNLCLSGS